MLDILKDIDLLTQSFLSSLPKGYLYNETLEPFIKGFLYEMQATAKKIDKAFNDTFKTTVDSYFLDDELRQYNLPNFIFTDVSTPEKKVFAIEMMKKANTLNSVEDYENFMALLGYNVKFYHNNLGMDNYGFPYSFPVFFTESLGKKDKLTWLIYIEDKNINQGEYNGLGDAFNIDFVESSTDLTFPKNVLDYLKPYDIIFQYITLETKTNLGL
jgi:hypothetical protein